MEKKTLNLSFALLIVLMVSIFSCNNAAEKKEIPGIATKDTEAVVATKKEASTRPPIINIMDTLSNKRIVLYMKDSAASKSRIGMKLGEIYGFKLAAVIKKNKLKTTGQPMAWYRGQKAPFFFEAGIPVDKIPAKLPSNVFSRQMGIDSVMIAHFHGPYEMLSLAYEALNDYMKDKKKKLKAMPYEIYADDPMDTDGKMKDPYKIQTDIVYPLK